MHCTHPDANFAIINQWCRKYAVHAKVICIKAAAMENKMKQACHKKCLKLLKPRCCFTIVDNHSSKQIAVEEAV